MLHELFLLAISEERSVGDFFQREDWVAIFLAAYNTEIAPVVFAAEVVGYFFPSMKIPLGIIIAWSLIMYEKTHGNSSLHDTNFFRWILRRENIPEKNAQKRSHFQRLF